MGDDFVETENYTEAVQRFSNAIERDPKYTYAYYNRGVIKELLNDQPGAIADFNKVLELVELGVVDYGLDALEYQIYFNLGLSKYRLGDTKGALADLNKAIELRPNKMNDSFFYFPYSIRASCKFKLEDYEGAIIDYTKAIEMQSFTSMSYGGRGFSKKLLGDLEGACKDYEKGSNLGDEFSSGQLKKYCR